MGLLPIWIERFALAVLATALVTLVILNVLKMDWIQRTTLGIGIICFSIYLAHSLYLFNESKKSVASPISGSGGSVTSPISPSQPRPEFTPEQMKEFQSAMREAMNNSKPPAPVKQIKADNRPFAFAIDVAFFSPSRDKTVMLYLASPGAEGMCIYPANLALYLRLQNLQEIPSRLAGWNLELEYGPDWVRAVELDSRFGTMYFADNAKSAGRLDNNVGFDVQLNSRSYVLKPLEVVEGWALFQYPKAHPFFCWRIQADGMGYPRPQVVWCSELA